MTATAAPFDALGADYDRNFSDRLPARWLRRTIRARVSPYLERGSKVIELGCGTGEDAIWFARQGCRVWAVDNSAVMLAHARAKITKAGTGDRIELQQLDVSMLTRRSLPDDFAADLVFSNFGVLNCIEDLAPVFDTAAQSLRDGGYLAATVMGKFCLTETVYFGLRGQFAKATRRWRNGARYRAAGKYYDLWYHSPGQLYRQAPHFDRCGLFGIGGLLPTSEGYAMCERSPRFFGALAELDRKIGRVLYPISDHYLILLRKRA